MRLHVKRHNLPNTELGHTATGTVDSLTFVILNGRTLEVHRIPKYSFYGSHFHTVTFYCVCTHLDQ